MLLNGTGLNPYYTGIHLHKAVEENLTTTEMKS